MKVKTQLLQKDIEAYFEADMEIRNNRYGLTPDTLTDALLAFHKAMMAAKVPANYHTALLSEFTQNVRAILNKPHQIGPVLENGVHVRAACVAGIIDGDPDAIGEMQPWEVTQLRDELTQAINKAYEVPKK